jgi:hypothetical protein
MPDLSLTYLVNLSSQSLKFEAQPEPEKIRPDPPLVSDIFHTSLPEKLLGEFSCTYTPTKNCGAG